MVLPVSPGTASPLAPALPVPCRVLRHNAAREPPAPFPGPAGSSPRDPEPTQQVAVGVPAWCRAIRSQAQPLPSGAGAPCSTTSSLPHPSWLQGPTGMPRCCDGESAHSCTSSVPGCQPGLPCWGSGRRTEGSSPLPCSRTPAPAQAPQRQCSSWPGPSISGPSRMWHKPRGSSSPALPGQQSQEL